MNHPDILDRLRELQRLSEADQPFSFVKDIWKSAADEIERLRAKVADQQQSIVRYTAGPYGY